MKQKNVKVFNPVKDFIKTPEFRKSFVCLWEYYVMSRYTNPDPCLLSPFQLKKQIFNKPDGEKHVFAQTPEFRKSFCRIYEAFKTWLLDQGNARSLSYFRFKQQILSASVIERSL